MSEFTKGMIIDTYYKLAHSIYLHKKIHAM